MLKEKTHGVVALPTTDWSIWKSGCCRLGDREYLGFTAWIGGSQGSPAKEVGKEPQEGPHWEKRILQQVRGFICPQSPQGPVSKSRGHWGVTRPIIHQNETWPIQPSLGISTRRWEVRPQQQPGNRWEKAFATLERWKEMYLDFFFF